MHTLQQLRVMCVCVCVCVVAVCCTKLTVIPLDSLIQRFTENQDRWQFSIISATLLKAKSVNMVFQSYLSNDTYKFSGLWVFGTSIPTYL